jgi:hypothetical protein
VSGFFCFAFPPNFPLVEIETSGWPDSDNFCLLGDRFLWAFFWKFRKLPKFLFLF